MKRVLSLSATIIAITAAFATSASAGTYVYADPTDGTAWIIEALSANAVHNWRPEASAKAACPHQYIKFEKDRPAKGRDQPFDAGEKLRGDFTVHLRCIRNKPRPSDEQIATLPMLGGGTAARMPNRQMGPQGGPMQPAGPAAGSLTSEQQLAQRLRQMSPEERQQLLDMLGGGQSPAART